MKKLIVAMFLITISPFILFNGCTDKESSDMNMNDDHAMMNNNIDLHDSTIIREKGFDVSSIDTNKDGKVFQCPMHFNVISDDNNKCPSCNMKLLEYTVEKAQLDFDYHMKR